MALKKPWETGFPQARLWTQDKGGDAALLHSPLLSPHGCPVWGTGSWRVAKLETLRAGHHEGEGLQTEEWVMRQGPSAGGREVSPDT